jgi:hypothetical protein
VFSPGRPAYFFHSLYFAARLFKWLRIPRQTGFRSPDRTRLLAWSHRVLGLLARLESRLLPGSLVGSSLACVASREQALR